MKIVLESVVQKKTGILLLNEIFNKLDMHHFWIKKKEIIAM